MAEEKKEGQPAKKPIDKMMLLSVGFAVINLIVLGSGVYMAYMGTLGWHPPTITEEQLAAEHEKAQTTNNVESGPLLYTMEKFTVNLDGEPRRVIRLEINLEMLNKDGFEEIINLDNRAKSRDKIVQILNSKTFAELETIQGKLFLKDQIATELNTLLKEGVVKNIFFTEFAVQ